MAGEDSKANSPQKRLMQCNATSHGGATKAGHRSVNFYLLPGPLTYLVFGQGQLHDPRCLVS